MMDEASQYLVEENVPMPEAATAKETYVAFVLDESGSMMGKEESVIRGFNDQLNVLRTRGGEGGDIKVALFKFGSPPDGRPRRLFRDKSPDEIRDLSRDNYRPAMNTPLNDAVGMAINDLARHDNPDSSVNRAFLVVVLTDGQENASREFTPAQIQSLIKEKQDTGRWTITFVGAEFDPTSLEVTRDVSPGNMTYTASVDDAMLASTDALASYFKHQRARGETFTTAYYTPSNDDDGDALDSGHTNS